MSGETFNSDWLPLKDPLYRIAFHLLETQDDAEDVVQDLYVKLWNSRGTLDAVKNPKAYCITLLKRMCIDRMRKATLQRLKEGQEGETDAVGAEQSLIEREELRQVRNLIGQLPERERKVLSLKVFEEKSYEEIGKITGISYLTLRVLVSNARRKIKNGLK